MPVLALRTRRQFGETLFEPGLEGTGRATLAENTTRCLTLSEEDQFGEGTVEAH